MKPITTKIYLTGPDGEEYPISVTFHDESAELHTHGGGPHEEGHSWHAETYRREGDRVTIEAATGGSDCDGPHSSLTFATLDAEGRYLDIDSSQRDHNAERAGY